MLSNITTLCFAGSYAVALALEASRLAFKSGVRGAVMIGFAAAGLFAHTAYLIAQAARASGPKETSLYSDNEDTLTSAMAPSPPSAKAAAPRRATREVQVGFGVDISQTVDSAAVEARRLELVRAITGEDEATSVETASPRARSRKRQALLAAGLFLGACVLGLGLVWVLAGA